MLSVDECKRLKEAGWPEAADNDAWIVDRKTGKAYVWPTTGELIAAIESLYDHNNYGKSMDDLDGEWAAKLVDSEGTTAIEGRGESLSSALADLYCKMKEANDGK